MGLRGHKISAEQGGRTVRFLGACIGSMHVALCAHWVRGIISPAEAGAEGLVTWANLSYERTDLAGRLSIHTNIPTAETRIVLYGNEQRSRSFMVGSVLGLVDIDRSEVHPLPTQFRGGERDRLPGYFSSTGYIALVANPFWVVDLPPRKNVLDAFILQSPEHHAEACKSEVYSPLASAEHMTSTEAVHAKSG